jgi:3-oxoacyl-(acyl-carrier-protein) synthase
MRKPDLNIRVAVTGAGIICSIGSNKGEVWRSICESRAAIRKLTRFRGESFPTDLAAEVEGDIQKLLPIGKRAARRLSRSDLLAVIAAAEAIGQANGNAGQPLPLARAIVSSGTSTGGLLEGEDYYFTRLVRGRLRAPASRVLQQPTSGPSDAVARVFNIGGGVDSNATA